MQFTGKCLRKKYEESWKLLPRENHCSLNLETSFYPHYQLKMIPNPHISNNTNGRLKVFQFASLNIWIKKEWIIPCLNLLLYYNVTENLQKFIDVADRYMMT